MIGYVHGSIEAAYKSAKNFHDWYGNPPYKKRIEFISKNLKNFYQEGLKYPEKSYNLKLWAKKEALRPTKYQRPSTAASLNNFLSNCLMRLRISLITLSDSEIRNLRNQFDKVCKQEKVGLYFFRTTKKWW